MLNFFLGYGWQQNHDSTLDFSTTSPKMKNIFPTTITKDEKHFPYNHHQRKLVDGK